MTRHDYGTCGCGRPLALDAKNNVRCTGCAKPPVNCPCPETEEGKG